MSGGGSCSSILQVTTRDSVNPISVFSWLGNKGDGVFIPNIYSWSQAEAIQIPIFQFSVFWCVQLKLGTISLEVTLREEKQVLVIVSECTQGGGMHKNGKQIKGSMGETVPR
jgi:hypothetical protein